MKTEVGSFTPGSSSFTVSLNDATLEPKGIEFQVSKAGSNVNIATGFYDGSANRGVWSFKSGALEDSGRSSSKCITQKKVVSGAIQTALEGSCTGFNTGEFDMSFSVLDSSFTVNYYVVGD